ncbi:DNA replication endonuclease-helicase Dna2, partial [Coemansia sp. RSA 2673]
GLDDCDGINDEGLFDVDGSNPQASETTGAVLASEPARRFKMHEKCLTLLVTDGLFTSGQLHALPNDVGARPQKIVRVYSQTARRELILLLRDQWYSTPVAIGDYLNISFTCLRRAVLKDWIREIPDKSQPNTAMLLGTLLHDLFQSCALKNKWDDATMSATIRSLIKDNIARLWECQVDETTVHEQIAECVPIYQEWARTYMHHSAQLGSTFSTHRNHSLANDPEPLVTVSKILTMEENVWSPKFGLKGKVDLTVLAKYTSQGALVQPFELKTGRNTQNTSHRAQLVLYTLLLSDRYDVDITSGLLYYPRTNEMVCVPRIDDELRGLVATRNEMIPFLTHSTNPSRDPPAMLGQEFMCKRCAIRPSCFIKHRAIEGGDHESAKMPRGVWEEQVGHLSQDHLDFVRVWMGLIDSEESDMQQYRSELWNMKAAYREANTGRCLSSLKMEVGLTEDTGVVGSYSRYRQTFVPAARAGRQSFLDSQLAVGDPIVVSSEAGHYAFMI